MAHPKRKQSKTRRDKRRTHYKAKAPTMSTCQNCNATIRSHHVCPECGHYRGQLVIDKEIEVS